MFVYRLDLTTHVPATHCDHLHFVLVRKSKLPNVAACVVIWFKIESLLRNRDLKSHEYRVQVAAHLMHTRPPNLSNSPTSQIARREESLDQPHHFLSSHLELELAFVPEELDVRQATRQNLTQVLQPEPVLDIQARCVSGLAGLVLGLEVLV